MTGHAAAAGSVLARIERLPRSRGLLRLVLGIASGGWFEFYELFVPGFISFGLVRSGLFTLHGAGPLDPHSFAAFLASFFVGMLIATLAFARLSDRFGRRPVFIWSTIVYSAAQFAVAGLSTALPIDLARLVAGLAVGVQLVNNDSYIAELVPGAFRGHYMGVAFVLILTAVPVAAFLSDLLVPFAPLGIAGWRWVVMIGGLGGVLVWFIQRGLPESPRWLELHGRTAEADRIVSRLERQAIAESGPLPAPGLVAAENPARAGGWTEMFSARYRARTAILSLFQFCQTIAVFGFTAFAPVMLVQKGFTVVHSLGYTALMVVLTPAGGLVGTLLAETMERKWQLVATALLVLAAGFGFAVARNGIVLVVLGGVIALGTNWQITTFHPYAAELFPTRFRASAIGFTFAWSRMSSILVGFWASALLSRFGPVAVFAMIGAAMLAITVSIAVFGPETNGRPLEDLSP